MNAYGYVILGVLASIVLAIAYNNLKRFKRNQLITAESLEWVNKGLQHSVPRFLICTLGAFVLFTFTDDFIIAYCLHYAAFCFGLDAFLKWLFLKICKKNLIEKFPVGMKGILTEIVLKDKKKHYEGKLLCPSGHAQVALIEDDIVKKPYCAFVKIISNDGMDIQVAYEMDVYQMVIIEEREDAYWGKIFFGDNCQLYGLIDKASSSKLQRKQFVAVKQVKFKVGEENQVYFEENEPEDCPENYEELL